MPAGGGGGAPAATQARVRPRPAGERPGQHRPFAGIRSPCDALRTMADRRALATGIVRRLREAGHEAYFAGGCVRDQLLGREPLDFDVATSAPPEVVGSLFRRTVPVGAQFGVILVVEDGVPFAVATFRSDDAYVDGRRPTRVRFVSAREDAERRDFTINGLFLDPLEGEIVDFVGGQVDLRAGIIRAIGDAQARIAEDRLRMLRAVRFAARLGFTIEPATRAAIAAAAPTVTDIAAERIGAEMAVAICQRLRRSRGVWERVAYLVRNHLRLVQAPEMRLSTLKKMLREAGFDELLALARIDALASNRDLRYVEFCERRRAELAADENIRPPRLLGGRDLIALGYAPGPRFGEILAALEEAQLEGQVGTREEAERFVAERYPRSER